MKDGDSSLYSRVDWDRDLYCERGLGCGRADTRHILTGVGVARLIE